MNHQRLKGLPDVELFPPLFIFFEFLAHFFQHDLLER
jgi:hypothetical protein